jgi:DNA polymerase
MDKQESLQKLTDEIIRNNVCPGLRSQATQLVLGDGNPDADIVFIGEAPGKQEDIQGVPFIGASGKFLAEMLATIGLSREDVYITNIVKYRPPANRDPLPAEIKAFMPYLFRQIEIIKPKLIVFLGRHAMNVFLPELKISQVHGQPERIQIKVGQLKTQPSVGHHGADVGQGDGEERSKPYRVYGERAPEPATPNDAANDNGVVGSADEQIVMSVMALPLYHPAAALYNGAMRETLKQDFSTIPALLSQLH